MKKLTVLLIILIIVSQITICPVAFEATDDESSAYRFASDYLNKYISNVYLKTEFDILDGTIAYFDDLPQIKKEILEKAKEYEDEIRKNHRYHYYEDNHWYFEHDMHWDSDVTPPAIQYDKTPIEDVVSSFPVFIEKKCQYMRSALPAKTVINHEMFALNPKSVTVSESGFAYVNCDSCYILLYRYKAFAEDMWFVCDISTFWDSYDEEFRFHSEDLDVEELLVSRGYTLLSENEESDTDTASDSADESDNETNNPPQESKPINYIPWVICTAEGVAIIALVIALIFKKKK